MLTIYDVYHPKADVDKFYVKGSRGAEWLISVEHCVGMEISSFDNHLMLTEEELLMCVKEFEEHNKRKGSQVKENVIANIKVVIKAKFCMGNCREVMIRQEEMQHGAG